MTENRFCTRCGQERKVSTNCLCFECASEGFMDALEGMHNKSGPYYERWLLGMERALRKARLVFDNSEQTQTPKT